MTVLLKSCSKFVIISLLKLIMCRRINYVRFMHYNTSNVQNTIRYKIANVISLEPFCILNRRICIIIFLLSFIIFNQSRSPNLA